MSGNEFKVIVVVAQLPLMYFVTVKTEWGDNSETTEVCMLQNAVHLCQVLGYGCVSCSHNKILSFYGVTKLYQSKEVWCM